MRTPFRDGAIDAVLARSMNGDPSRIALTGDQPAGGTNTPGIAPDVFAMPPGLSIRYDRPAEDLRDYITGYHVYSAHGARAMGQVDWFLPGTANVRIALDAGPIAIEIGRQRFDPVPDVSLFGPTSHALKATTNGGVLIGFGISAIGWSRLFKGSAAAYRDRIVPLEQAMADDVAPQLRRVLQASNRADQVAPLLDGLLRQRLGRVHRDEATIRRMMHLVTTDGPDDIVGMASTLGVQGAVLRRLAVRHFGFPPKLLLRRARFLRSLLRVTASEKAADYTLIDSSYYDISHFLRDANAFLGMTPRRFIGLSTPFLDASVRARRAVLGAQTQALHDIAFD